MCGTAGQRGSSDQAVSPQEWESILHGLVLYSLNGGISSGGSEILILTLWMRGGSRYTPNHNNTITHVARFTDQEV